MIATGTASPATSSIRAMSSDRSTPARVAVYSDDSSTRETVIRALGPEYEFLEIATPSMVISIMDSGTVDLAILDGEASPAGGLGLAKQLKDELDPCPPLLVLTGRPDDRWLAKWSNADASVSHPIDPIALGAAVAKLLRP